MKGRLLVLALLGVAIGGVWYLVPQNPRPWPAFNRQMEGGSFSEPIPEPVSLKAVPFPAMESNAVLAEVATNGATADSNATTLAALPPELTPLAALEQTRIALHLYTSMFGENPIGLNFEIARALNGHNPKQVQFLRPEAGMRLNAQGELVDLWGTPYFFHQLSGTQMEIRSAGPDRVMWTADDLVVR